ncbi:Gpi1p [Malassezia vespertilionis]|uniref:Gpi1p n=1 Tax=Malassezia vespertilionis TaxID=2020962 RepID=A0A2N1J719_9BASI|nr:Gpi1p [Malassezia vespertilionis]
MPDPRFVVAAVLVLVLWKSTAEVKWADDHAAYMMSHPVLGTALRLPEYKPEPRATSPEPRACMCKPVQDQGVVYGWCISNVPHELIFVAAGLSPGRHVRSLHGAQSAAPIGTWSTQSLPHAEAPKAHSFHAVLAKEHAFAPQLNWIHAGQFAPNCHVAILLFPRPNAAKLQWLPCNDVPSQAPTKLEQFIAMDPKRGAEMATPKAMQPGAGFCAAVRYINMSSYAWTQHAHSYVWIGTAPSAPHIALLHRAALYGRIRFRIQSVLAWLAYWQLYASVLSAIAAGNVANIEQLVPAAARAAARAWNMLGLYVLDMAAGYIASAALCTNMASVQAYIASLLALIAAPQLRQVFDWLAHWPLGIKLNTELAMFIRDTMVSVCETHTRYILAPFQARTTTFLHLSAWVSRYLGLSVMLAMWLDILWALTAHIFVMHTVLRHVYHFCTRSAGALFDMFQGKKRNALHGGRLDEAQYEVDQLCLGTILFTMVVFLFPTVLLFYMTSALIQLFSLLLHGGIATWIGVQSALPLYELVVRLCNPMYLPATFVFRPRKAHTHFFASVYQLECVPVSLFAILAPLLQACSPYFALPRLCSAVLRGDPWPSLDCK